MLRNVIWLTRTAGIVIVGLLTFVHEPYNVQALPLQIGAFAAATVAMAASAVIELLPGVSSRLQRAVPFLLGFTAIAAGLACATRGGSYLVILAAIAVMSAGGDPSLATGLSILGLGVLAIEIGGLVYGDSIAALFGFPLALVSALLLGENRRSYLLRTKQSAAMLAQAQQLQEQQRRADVLDERARIAREIHDVLAHSLGALGIQIQAARAVLSDHHDIDRALGVLGTAQRMASDGLAETRRAVHALRSDTLPLDEEVAAAADRHATQNHVPVSFAVGGQPRPLPPAATMALLRIAQEGLVNAAKHAPDQPVDVHLDYGNQDVRLTLANPIAHRRAGGDPGLSTVNGGYGLTGMHERLLLVNGTLSAGPQDGRWVVTATLPRPAGPGAVAAGPAGAGE